MCQKKITGQITGIYFLLDTLILRFANNYPSYFSFWWDSFHIEVVASQKSPPKTVGQFIHGSKPRSGLEANSALANLFSQQVPFEWRRQRVYIKD